MTRDTQLVSAAGGENGISPLICSVRPLTVVNDHCQLVFIKEGHEKHLFYVDFLNACFCRSLIND